MNTRYVFKPEKESIYLYKEQPITVHYGSGQISLFDLKGRYVDDMPEYSDEADQVSTNSIGTIIRPRWNKEYQTWVTSQRGLRYDQIVHDGES